MQGGRSNAGRKTTPMSGMQSTRMHGAALPAPKHTRPQPATPQGAPRSGSRVIAEAGHGQLIGIGMQTGTPAQTIAPVQVVQPSPPPKPPAERGPSPPPHNDPP